MTTNKQLLATVEGHLFSQGHRSLKNPGANNPACAYRSPDGLKCAVGCLIDDRNYFLTLEGKPADNESVIDALAQSLGVDHLSTATISMLLALQAVHDSIDPKEWMNATRAIRFSIQPFANDPIDKED